MILSALILLVNIGLHLLAHVRNSVLQCAIVNITHQVALGGVKRLQPSLDFLLLDKNRGKLAAICS